MSSSINVEFLTAILKDDSASDVRIWYAITPFGLRGCREDRDKIFSELIMQDLSHAESIVTVDLDGLERDLLEAIVDLILGSGLLRKPGVKGKGDAVLFMLTNEALHALAQIAREEEAKSTKDPLADT